MGSAAAGDQQGTNQSSGSRRGWGSIVPSLWQVETLEWAREALRRSSLGQTVLPVPVQQQREEQLQLGVRHTGACHCWVVEVEAYCSQAMEQACA